jgi:1-pyrroline-5-carboxylate dehydrogenase
VGDPVTNSDLGPVINQAALNSMLGYIETGKREGRLIAGGNAPQTSDGGYFLEPTIFADVAPNAVLAQEEIFGPVLAVIKVANFEEGLRVANNTEYGLTGSLYTNDPARKAAARSAFHVGNLYFNRKCTGAMVGAHPFGGFNMSGTDSKAGGPDYLTLFTQVKSVAEKLTETGS